MKTVSSRKTSGLDGLLSLVLDAFAHVCTYFNNGIQELAPSGILPL